ncbi:hypothetical protein U1Q18_023698 [Sarracenia purpurea var. burkii]
MEAISPLHHLNPPLLRNSLTNKRPICRSIVFRFLRVEETSSPEPQISASFPPSSFRCLSGYPELSSLNSVKVMHSEMTKMDKNENSDANIQSLITYYLNFGDCRSAAMVFFVGFGQNYLHWNIFLEEFKSFGGHPFEVLEVFVELHNNRVSFDSGVLTVILKICANLKERWLGMEVHVCLIKDFYMDVYSKCALMTFYGRCWGVNYANKAFYEMPEEVLLWNEIVLVNLRIERWVEALQLFRDMQFSYAKANSFTLAKVL